MNASRFQPVLDEIHDELHQTNDSITEGSPNATASEITRAASVDSAISVSNSSSAKIPNNEADGDEACQSTSEDEDVIGEAIDESLLPKTCTVLTTPSGATVYLVGTAHFSRESQEDVIQVRIKLKRSFFII